MSETAQKLLEQIRALPEADRRWVAGQMWEPDDWSDETLAGPPPIPEQPTTTLAQELWGRVAALSRDDQQFIADEVFPELDDGSDLMDDPEFRAELERRLEEVEKHPEKLLTLEEAQQRIDETLARRRAERGGA
jgi:putative addiction module component (TIGR02574 family)